MLDKLFDIKADKQPIAIYLAEKPFTSQQIKLQKGDKFYLFSDGFADQIGGAQRRKYLSKNFKKLLLDIHSEDFQQQSETLATHLDQWQSGANQVDDVLVLGFQV